MKISNIFSVSIAFAMVLWMLRGDAEERDEWEGDIGISNLEERELMELDQALSQGIRAIQGAANGDGSYARQIEQFRKLNEEAIQRRDFLYEKSLPVPEVRKKRVIPMHVKGEERELMELDQTLSQGIRAIQAVANGDGSYARQIEQFRKLNEEAIQRRNYLEARLPPQ